MRKREQWLKILGTHPTVADVLFFTREAERVCGASNRLMQQWRTALTKLAERRLSDGVQTPLDHLEAAIGKMHPRGAEVYYLSRARKAVTEFRQFRDDPAQLWSLMERARSKRTQRRSTGVGAADELTYLSDELNKLAANLAQIAVSRGFERGER